MVVSPKKNLITVKIFVPYVPFVPKGEGAYTSAPKIFDIYLPGPCITGR